MPQPGHVVPPNFRRIRNRTCLVLAALTALAGAAFTAFAVAKTFTLTVAKNARVTSVSGTTTQANILVNSRGRAVYALTGDSARHPECTQANGCFMFWPPVKAASARKISRAAGVKGKLGTWRRDGFLQLTLNGHPLYTFSQDRQKDHATGEGLHTFGGTWHVSRAGGASTGSTGSTGTQPQPPMTTGTTTTPTYPTY
jgi:predicted lipoprotein with Yx(FWY)xxD motif